MFRQMGAGRTGEKAEMRNSWSAPRCVLRRRLRAGNQSTHGQNPGAPKPIRRLPTGLLERKTNAKCCK
jgi:hypothetical protein